MFLKPLKFLATLAITLLKRAVYLIMNLAHLTMCLLILVVFYSLRFLNYCTSPRWTTSSSTPRMAKNSPFIPNPNAMPDTPPYHKPKV